MSDNKFKYWAFLSYSLEDNREQRSDTSAGNRRCWGNWLHEALKNFSIPPEFVGQINGRGEIIPERMDSLFQDETELPGEPDLSAEVRLALEQSSCLIVVCSPRSAKSRQMNEAVRYFKQIGRGQHILPIVVAGEPNASNGNQPGRSPENECFVPALRHVVSPEGTLDTTRRAGKSIFVDARHGVDKREILATDHRNAEADLEMAKIQLIALLLGVGFNGLWCREQKRHFFDFAEAQHSTREALKQVEEVRRELEEAQRQTRMAQNQALETQNLPRDVHGQIQEAHNQTLTAQNQTREAEKQLQEFQNKVRDTQTQLEEARQRALAAESKVLEAQNQERETRNELEATRHQVREAQNQVLEIQNLAPALPNQIAAAQSEVLKAQSEAQNKQSQVQEFQNQARSAQNQLEEARQQIREIQGKVMEAQHQAREAQNQVRLAQTQVHEIRNNNQAARRLTKVLALIAVLAALAASIAWWQRQIATQTLTQAATTEVWESTLAASTLNGKQIRQALKNIGGAEQAGNQRRSLDQLAAAIPGSEIPEALQAATVIVDDQHRSHFQKWLLVRLGWINPMSAMACASASEGNIVNDAGLSDSSSYFQLAILDNWLETDLSGACHWVCQMPDAAARQLALEKIINTVQSQPDSDSKNHALVTCIDALAKTDVSRALTLAQSLPEGVWRSAVISFIAEQPDTSATLNWINNAYWPQQIMQPRTAPSTWTKFLLNLTFGSPTIFSVETKIFSNPAPGLIQIKSEEE